jgi:hypothetical protein
MADKADYQDLCHAMQSGVAAKMVLYAGASPRSIEASTGETSPKHLRVGVNAAMCDHSALVELLIKKGIITSEEYLDSATEVMAREVASYERELSEAYGSKVTLH